MSNDEGNCRDCYSPVGKIWRSVKLYIRQASVPRAAAEPLAAIRFTGMVGLCGKLLQNRPDDVRPPDALEVGR